MQALVVTCLVAIGTTGAVLLARDDATQAAIDQVTGIAVAVAHAPTVIEAARTPNPSAVLQPYAESVRRATHTDFVVVMATDRTRWTHPTANLIGQPFIGTIAGALAGGRVVETHAGTLGESVRTVVPVLAGRTVIALVSVGITTDAINKRLLGRAPVVLIPAAVALLLAAAGSWLLSRRLSRQTHGLGPAEMTRMYEYHDAVLHSVREGLIVVDRSGQVTLINDSARALVGASEGLPPELADLIATRAEVTDEPVLVGDRVLVANQRVIPSQGHLVITLRDHTELRALTGELDSVRGLTEALRAQAHESANRLHTVLTLVELGRSDEAVRLATAELEVAQQLTDQVVGAVREPALAALLLGKSAQAAERGVQLVVDEASSLSESPPAGRDLLTVVGNLVDNALEAVAGTPPPRKVTVLVVQEDGEVRVTVSDTGPGMPDPAAAFRRGWTTKEGGRGVGLSLVRQVTERYGGAYDVQSSAGTIITVRLPVPS
ncbi:histidine kinase [Paractinoplanes toevensis]|uniref:histidine kinase n=1 Tax=Paractinoplanes toevensis TaxID=571911 RepID=A0A919W1T9_9ACTN|nr:histidine kinase [Actinoplanes toevensis]